MAVEAHHLHVFPPQLIPNREILNPIEANVKPFNPQMGYSSVLPLSGTATATETLLPAAAAYNSLIVDSVPQKTAMKSESGLTSYNVPVPRKRSRDSINYPSILSYPVSSQTHKNCRFFSFLGEDISLKIHQQQLDVDRLISLHMEKVRMELEEKRKRQAMRIIEAIETGMMKRLKTKEEEIEKMGKLNWALEERVKSLCVENQIWRDLAQTNEATANALRTNIEQVLAQRAADDDNDDATVAPAGPAPLLDDAESCCGSTAGGDEDDDANNNHHQNETRQATMDGCWYRVVASGSAPVVKDKDEEGTARGGGGGCSSSKSRRLCKNCGKEESCVLILPCRHLCLCTVCGSTLHTCPICKSSKNASVHVNMSS